MLSNVCCLQVCFFFFQLYIPNNFFFNWKFVATLHQASPLVPFFIIMYVTVICDHWSLMLLLWLFWGTMNHSHIRWSINVVFWLLYQTDCSPISLPIPRLPFSLRHNNIEIRSVSNPTMVSKCSSERNSCTSLTLNQKLEMIKLSEEGMLKVKIGWKLGFLCRTPSQVVMAKDRFSKEMKNLYNEHMNGKKMKLLYCL